MSTYTNQDAVLGEIPMPDLVSLTDDNNNGTVDSTVLSQVIANASGYIDSRVSNIYDVPFVVVPSSVASMALTITCYRLYRRRLVPDEKNKFAEDWAEVKEFLNLVNKGEANIDLTEYRDFPQVTAIGRKTIYGASAFSTNAPFNSM